MENAHKKEFRIRDLPTKSVTLFPTRAQVVREIKDVVLKPGANEITVLGLTPTVDEHSIKVEGTGSAIITDITVELLPNRDIFEEIYPDSDEEKDESDDSDSDDDGDDDKVNKALEDVLAKIQVLMDDQARATEAVSSAQSRLKILDAYGGSLDKKRGVDIQASIETYRAERDKVFQDHLNGTVRGRELAKEIQDLRKEQTRLEKLAAKEALKVQKAKEKIERAKAKQKEKERRREAERQKEKTRIRKERENFWPRSCYTVRISLDAASFTPSSSRRSSIASASDVVKVVAEKESASSSSDLEGSGYTCDLLLSYVTSSAFWSPSYDLALSTTTNTAMLCFDARLTNMTSETWANSKVTLSTSQTIFSGLQDAIPTLVPWRVKLAGKWAGDVQNGLIDSREERSQKSDWQVAQAANYAQKPRAQYFGVDPSIQSANYAQKSRAQFPGGGDPSMQAFAQFAVAQQQCQVPDMPKPAVAPAPAASLFGSRPAGGGGDSNSLGFGAPAPFAAAGGLFGGASTNVAPDVNSNNITASMESARNAPGRGFSKAKRKSAAVTSFGRSASSYDVGEGGSGNGNEGDEEDDDVDGNTILEPTPELSFQESAFEETGLTATYDLPGLKTLKPSSTASKQRVARVSFSSVYFSHTVVAKYRPVAYLKAKLRNTSKLTLLKGATGLTLDGTFMGRSTLPRCSAGDSFTLSLGVDPAIRVVYPKPEVRRSTTGVFSKGDNFTYTRAVTLTNTRASAGKPVNLLVLDQVPVSEDEKLRVDIQQPVGLTGSAVGPVTAGVAVCSKDEGAAAAAARDWGKATATRKKAGEVAWDVVLNAGRTVRLSLEYDVAMPVGERVIQC